MSSRSSSETPRLLPVGRVAGHRGNAGELTVKVPDRDAGPWRELDEVWLDAAGGGDARRFPVESARTYGNRLVLKLAGVDDADAAERLRGRTVFVARERAPAPPPGRYWVASLLGLDVVDDAHGPLGRVRDVVKTGGTDLLVVERADGGEDLLVPLAEEIVLDVDERKRRIRVRSPEGLLELNRVVEP